MTLQVFFSVLFATSLLVAQENLIHLEPTALAQACCPQVTPRNSSADCCEPTKLNCPPLTPYCDPCDCIIDYYPPLVFTGFDLTVEYLFWTVQQKRSTFALATDTIHQVFPPSTVGGSYGTFQSANFDWNSGVRTALGYTFERDAWHLLGQYTFYHTTGTRNVLRSTDPTLYLTPTMLNVTLSNYGPGKFISQTNFNYQVADLLISRRYLPACQILLNLFTGATGAWIDEKWSVASLAFVDSISQTVITFTENNWSFNGGGIEAGFDANWHLGSGFGLFNKVAFSALIGSYHNSRRTALNQAGLDHFPGGPGSVNNPARNTTESEIWIVPHSQIELGLNWNHRFNCWSMALQAALEVNNWYDLHELHQDGTGFALPIVDRKDPRNTSDVKLWGLTLTADFNF